MRRTTAAGRTRQVRGPGAVLAMSRVRPPRVRPATIDRRELSTVCHGQSSKNRGFLFPDSDYSKKSGEVAARCRQEFIAFGPTYCPAGEHGPATRYIVLVLV